LITRGALKAWGREVGLPTCGNATRFILVLAKYISIFILPFLYKGLEIEIR
jgi:hypothetical protein